MATGHTGKPAGPGLGPWAGPGWDFNGPTTRDPNGYLIEDHRPDDSSHDPPPSYAPAPEEAPSPRPKPIAPPAPTLAPPPPAPATAPPPAPAPIAPPTGAPSGIPPDVAPSQAPLQALAMPAPTSMHEGFGGERDPEIDMGLTDRELPASSRALQQLAAARGGRIY